ncbi:hypothetical protein GCM10010399_91390 [Dactylosporangium fulvum]
MLEPGDHLRLGADPLAVAGLGGQFPGEELDRDVAVEHKIAGAPDHRHAAGADRCDEPVSVPEDFVGRAAHT